MEIKDFKVEKLRVRVFDNRDEAGKAAAADAAAYLREKIAERGEINTIFAAAPSQNDMLSYLSKEDVDWQKVTAYHMDEYIGLSKDAPQRFSKYLYDHIFSLVDLKKVHYLAGDDGKLNPVYNDFFSKNHVEICFMGVGENGHIAFNDPCVAELFDFKYVKDVDLDEVCRMQQVHDGCFESLDKVPKSAMTLTVPTLMRSEKLLCVAPTDKKAQAIHDIVYGPITMDCPASAMRIHDNATLYIDKAAASLLNL